jgi:hypothetical protein
MVAANPKTKFRCYVIAIPAPEDSTRDLRPKPSELVPWADPYIASLVRKLQDEVRADREARWAHRSFATD